MTADAYSGFRHAATAPLVQIDSNLFALELFHGPDAGVQGLRHAMARPRDEPRARRARAQRATLLGATSGDTGAAAIEAFGGQTQTDVYILYPHGRVSDVQRRQMTTAGKPNVHALAIDGTFDDCQRIVKDLFGDLAFRDEMSLSGVNSINWARILAQIVYYFTSAVALGAPERPVSFSVPTGNFGDILAGYYAKRMGLPIERLIVATNENDILARALASGRYEPRGVKPTQSPSMDIQVSSNFERLLFEASGQSPEVVRSLMADFARDGWFAIPSAICSASGPTSTPSGSTRPHARRKWAASIAKAGSSSILIAPSASPQAGGRSPRPRRRRSSRSAPPIRRSSPTRSNGRPACAPRLPPHLADLMDRRETIVTLPNDRNAVADYLRQTARAPA